MMADEELLRRFANERDESAFTELVRRRIDFVYAVALRQVGGDAHLAQDAAQEVFLDLARKARSVAAGPALVSWLYTATRFSAAKVRRRQTRWLNREQEALTMNTILSDGTDPEWETLQPVLDAAMHELGEQDRTALLLRYFENRPLAEVGAKLGLAENSARMRVDRALDKLRTRLAKRGIISTAAALGSTLAAQPTISAPLGLAASAATGALTVATAGHAAMAGTLFFAMKKSAVAAGAFLIAATAAVIVVQNHETKSKATNPSAVSFPSAPQAPSPIPPSPTGIQPPAKPVAVTPPDSAGGSLDLDRLVEDMKQRAAEVAPALAVAQASSAEAAKTNLSSTTSPSPAVNAAAVAGLRDAGAALAFFRTIPFEDLPAYLQYVYTIDPPDRREILMPALFQAWTEQHADEAMAAANQAGDRVLQWALSGWAKTDLQAAWNWAQTNRPFTHVLNMNAVIEAGVAANQETTLAAWLTASTASPLQPDIGSYSLTLAKTWAAKDIYAASAWVKELEAAHPGSTSQALLGIGNAAAKLPPDEFTAFLAQQDDTAWKSITSGAIIVWVGSDQLDRLQQFLGQTETLRDDRHDGVLTTMALAITAKNPDLSFQVAQRIRNPGQRDRSLGSLSAMVSTKQPELAMQVALAIADRTNQATRLISTYRKWESQNPEDARKFLERPNFPADVRAKLLEQ